ncbi:MAG: hypothetical protein AAGM22_28125 [Acidobacteriota bacterium]
MTHFMCIVQENQAAHRATDRLEAGLREISARYLGDGPTEISWHVATPGDMFTGGRPSTSSIVSAAVTRLAGTADRKQILGALCELWMDETGCSSHDVLVAIADATPASA